MARLDYLIRPAFAAVVLSLSCGAAMAQDAPVPDEDIVVDGDRPDPVEVEETEVDDPVICRKQEAPTASRISRRKKVCKTRSEWRLEDEYAEQHSDEVMQSLKSGMDQEVRQRTGGPLSGLGGGF